MICIQSHPADSAGSGVLLMNRKFLVVGSFKTTIIKVMTVIYRLMQEKQMHA